MTEVADGREAREPRAALKGVEQSVDTVQDPQLLGGELPLADPRVDPVKQIPGVFQEQGLELRVIRGRFDVSAVL